MTALMTRQDVVVNVMYKCTVVYRVVSFSAGQNIAMHVTAQEFVSHNVSLDVSLATPLAAYNATSKRREDK